jgi:hypothetical protein
MSSSLRYLSNQIRFHVMEGNLLRMVKRGILGSDLRQDCGAPARWSCGDTPYWVSGSHTQSDRTLMPFEAFGDYPWFLLVLLLVKLRQMWYNQ